MASDRDHAEKLEDRGFLKIFGLERSGTNYLRWALERAFRDAYILVDETGWKHGMIPACVDWTGRDWSDPTWPDAMRRRHAAVRLERLGRRLETLKSTVDEGRLRVCAILKDPYAWVSSFATYCRVPCSPVDVAMIVRWNEVNRQYYDYAMLHSNRSAIVRYEDLIMESCKTVDRLAGTFGLTRNGCRRFSLRLAMTPTGRRDGRVFDKSRYAEERFMAGYSSLDVQTFSEFLDGNLMAALGYRLRRP